jgi:hypothetical protein
LTTCLFTLSDNDGIKSEDAVISVEPSVMKKTNICVAILALMEIILQTLFKLTAPKQNGASVTVQLEVTGELNFETAQLHTLTLAASDVRSSVHCPLINPLLHIQFKIKSS